MQNYPSHPMVVHSAQWKRNIRSDSKRFPTNIRNKWLWSRLMRDGHVWLMAWEAASFQAIGDRERLRDQRVKARFQKRQIQNFKSRC
eukprot:5946615-Amphidinium_carterae.1